MVERGWPVCSNVLLLSKYSKTCPRHIFCLPHAMDSTLAKGQGGVKGRGNEEKVWKGSCMKARWVEWAGARISKGSSLL